MYLQGRPTVTATFASRSGVYVASEWQGASALEVARGDVPGREPAFGYVGRQVDYERCFVRRSDGWKLLWPGDDGTFLFDVTATPEELPSQDRSADGLPEYRALSSMLDEHGQHVSGLRRNLGGVDQEGEMVEQHLRELGYLE